MAERFTKTYHLRCCRYHKDGEMETGYFHCWEQYSEIVPPDIMVGGHSGGCIASVYAIIEDKEGFIHRVLPEKIHFIRTDTK